MSPLAGEEQEGQDGQNGQEEDGAGDVWGG